MVIGVVIGWQNFRVLFLNKRGGGMSNLTIQGTQIDRVVVTEQKKNYIYSSSTEWIIFSHLSISTKFTVGDVGEFIKSKPNEMGNCINLDTGEPENVEDEERCIPLGMFPVHATEEPC